MVKALVPIRPTPWAALTVTTAHVTAVPDGNGGTALQLMLTPVDAPGLDRLAAANYGKQVAMVMFGKVIVAPTVDATHFNGVITITGANGIDPQVAANVESALSG